MTIRFLPFILTIIIFLASSRQLAQAFCSDYYDADTDMCWPGMADPDCCNCDLNNGYYGTAPTCNYCVSKFANDDPALIYCDPLGASRAIVDVSNPTSPCTCVCRNQFYGTLCEKCPSFYERVEGFCSRCIDGYALHDYPNGTQVCSPKCTPADDCNNKGTPPIDSTKASGCTPCSCTGNYNTSTNCKTCLQGYDIAQDCAVCSTGYEKDGVDDKCYKTCTVGDDCSPGASGVAGTYKNGCKCFCADKWFGARCDQCPPLMDAQCRNCIAGYETPGNCTKTCTLSDCMERAIEVKGNYTVGCSCSCRNYWTGPIVNTRVSNCSICPALFNATDDCKTCINGYTFVNNTCLELCTDRVDCYNHSLSVDGTKGGCRCTCRNQWSLSNCSVCPSRYVGSDCDTCAQGFIEYPVCKRNCTSEKDCNFHASDVEGFPNNTCKCTCRNKWSGPSCAVCPPMYNSSVEGDCATCNQTTHEGVGMSCYKKCTITLNCSGRATSVTGNANTTCQCACVNAWGGPECDVCPPIFNKTNNCSSCAAQYEKYPFCHLKCTNAANCTGHAANVSGNIVDGCQCTCDPLTKWQGLKCDSCPANYEQTQCKTCSANYTKYPDCYLKCTVAANCSGNAVNATGDTSVGCNCTCKDKWQGPECNICPSPGGNLADNCRTCLPGYDGPRCERLCTVETDCNGMEHATSVSGFEGNCSCVCNTKWSGRECEVCPVRYNSTNNCDGCAAGYVRYPHCFLNCTIEANCSSNAVAVSGDSNSSCSCTCRNQWSAPNCSVCESRYDMSQDCNTCAPSYNFFPFCVRDCTVEKDCSGYLHSSGVVGVFPNCTCSCLNSWQNPSCATCPNMYDPLRNCSECAPGHRGVYPSCNFICTVAANCSGQAVNVSGDSSTGCSCQCAHSWEGKDCSVCPPRYNNNTNCSTCATHYMDYPTCYYVCNDELDCSGHSTNVTGTNWDCKCTCRNNWTSANCSVCPVNYNSTRDCGACAAGYDTYPHCYLTCTTEANCTGHAVNVTGNTDTGCSCSCRNSWYGKVCDLCPPTYDKTKDCNACIPGWSGFPNCRELCTNETDCSGRALNVSGYKGECVCECRNGYEGHRCDVCPPRYEQEETADCGACTEGFDSYPLCALTCTVERDCEDKATNVTGNNVTGCHCTCRNMWHSLNCSQCASNYESRADCGKCADGYADYPRCARICTNWEDCSGNAGVTSGLYPNCSCQCRDQWYGKDCAYCPQQYDPNDCATCAQGYTGVYPQCSFICTIAANCSSHATDVEGTTLTGCNCTCRNQWHGGNCSLCEPRYDPAKDCGGCNYGYEAYPLCRTACMVDRDCNERASNVTGMFPNCTCACRNQWQGDRCELCPAKYNATADCSACNADREFYPHCYRKCNFSDCSNNAVEVSGNENTNCTCKCRNAYEGDKCDVCPPNVNASRDCAECKVGFGGYPLCGPMCTPSDCTNRSVSVSGGRPFCKCVCRNGWSGPDCSVCPPEYNISSDCFSCSPGHVKVNGTCYRYCNVTLDCNGRGTNVTGNLGIGCKCTCRNNYTAPVCAECPAGYNADNDCTGCADGWAGFPNCKPLCKNETDCTGRAEVVSGTIGNCKCVCHKGWWGKKCEICPAQYNIWDDCGSCNKYRRQDYPNCSRLSRSMPTPTFTSVLHTLTHMLPSNTTSATLPLPYSFTASTLTQYLSSTASLEHTYSVSTSWSGTSTLSTTVSGATYSLNATQSLSRPETRTRPVPPTRTARITVTITLPDCSLERHCLHANRTYREGYDCICVCNGNWTGARCDKCPSQYSTYIDSKGVIQGCGECAPNFVMRNGTCLTSSHFYGTLDAGNSSCDGSTVTTRQSSVGVGSRRTFLQLMSGDLRVLLMGVYAHHRCPNAEKIAKEHVFTATVFEMYPTSNVVPARDVRYLFDAVFWNESKAVALSMSACMSTGMSWLLDVWRNGGAIPTTTAPTTTTTLDPKHTTTAATRTPRPTFAPAGSGSAAVASARVFRVAANESDASENNSTTNATSEDSTMANESSGELSSSTTMAEDNITMPSSEASTTSLTHNSATANTSTEMSTPTEANATSSTTSVSSSSSEQTTTPSTSASTSSSTATATTQTSTSTTSTTMTPPPASTTPSAPLYPLLFFGNETMFPTMNASDYIGGLLGINGTGCLAFAGGSFSYGDYSRCGLIGCAPEDFDPVPPEEGDPFPWWWVVLGLIGAALLLVALLIFRRYRLRRRIEEVVNPKDTHKYTLQFLLSEDEELRQIAKDREDEEMDFFDDDDLL